MTKGLPEPTRIRHHPAVTDSGAPPKADDEAAPDAVFTALWARALEAWEEDGPHRALLEHALKANLLPDLAGRYRALVEDPDKGTRAQKQIDRIVAAATQMMFAMKTPPRTKTPTSWTLSAALFFVLVVGFLAYALVRRH